MKNIFLNKVIIIVPALFAIMLIHTVVAGKGQETHKAPATSRNSIISMSGLKHLKTLHVTSGKNRMRL